MSIPNSKFGFRGAKPLELMIEDARYKGFSFIAILEEEDSKAASLNVLKISETDWDNFKRIPIKLVALRSELEKRTDVIRSFKYDTSNEVKKLFISLGFDEDAESTITLTEDENNELSFFEEAVEIGPRFKISGFE